MFKCDFFEILGPITIESQFFFSEEIEPIHYASNTVLKTQFELLIVIISSFDNDFVMFSIGYFDLMT
jgi:hypothetical protein